MSTSPAKTVKLKKSPEQALALLKEKQKALALKTARLEKGIEERKNAANQSQRLKIGKFAEDAGILNLGDDDLKKAFAEIASKHGMKATDATPPAA